MNFLRPEFFDIFGIGVFSFLTFLSWRMRMTQILPPRWSIILLLIIGISGLIVDGCIVYKTYIKKH